MNFINLYVEVLKAFGDFKTRTGRTKFWVFTIVNVIVSAILGYLSYTLSSIYSIIVFIPSIAVGVRRLHDVGKSGKNLLWGFIPVLGWVYLIYLFILDSEEGENQWGAKPEEVKIS